MARTESNLKFTRIKQFGYTPRRIFDFLENHRWGWMNGIEKFYRNYSWSEFNKRRILRKRKPITLRRYRKTRQSFYYKLNNS